MTQPVGQPTDFWTPTSQPPTPPVAPPQVRYDWTRTWHPGPQSHLRNERYVCPEAKREQFHRLNDQSPNRISMRPLAAASAVASTVGGASADPSWIRPRPRLLPGVVIHAGDLVPTEAIPLVHTYRLRGVGSISPLTTTGAFDCFESRV